MYARALLRYSCGRGRGCHPVEVLERLSLTPLFHPHIRTPLSVETSCNQPELRKRRQGKQTLGFAPRALLCFYCIFCVCCVFFNRVLSGTSALYACVYDTIIYPAITSQPYIGTSKERARSLRPPPYVDKLFESTTDFNEKI